ncbi:MAG TPA: hypothetical protein VL916_08455 [Ilumatobacteraceae bacterium]|nr:hypothetical protein [Ilumatobacteraceae bacterium]
MITVSLYRRRPARRAEVQILSGFFARMRGLVSIREDEGVAFLAAFVALIVIGVVAAVVWHAARDDS